MTYWSSVKRMLPFAKTPSLLQIVSEHHGKVSDKWGNFLSEYEQFFSRFRSVAVTMLEIGVQNGGSLEIWADYFAKAKAVVGVDVNEKCGELRFSNPAITVVVGDANTDLAYKKITSAASAFDIIIDDGSHKSSDIIRSFARYFPILKRGGLYIVEDLHCSYWAQFEGGLGDPASSMEFLKTLADFPNAEHWRSQPQKDILEIFKSRYGVSIDAATLSSIYSVRFSNSLCVIEKRDSSLGPRRVIGSEARVDAGPLELKGNGAQKSASSQEVPGPADLVKRRSAKELAV